MTTRQRDLFLLLSIIIFLFSSAHESRAQANRGDPGCVTVRTAEHLAIAMQIVNQGCDIDLVPGDTLNMAPYEKLDVANSDVKVRTYFGEDYRPEDLQQGGAVLLYDRWFESNDEDGFLFVITQDNFVLEGLTIIGPEGRRGPWRDSLGVVGAIKFQHARNPGIYENHFINLPKWAVQVNGYAGGRMSFNKCQNLQDDGFGYCLWLGPDGVDVFVDDVSDRASVEPHMFIFSGNQCDNVRKCVDGSSSFSAVVRHNTCTRCFVSFMDIHDGSNQGAGWVWYMRQNISMDNRSTILELRSPPKFYGEVRENYTPNSCGAFAFVDDAQPTDSTLSLFSNGNYGSFDNKNEVECFPDN